MLKIEGESERGVDRDLVWEIKFKQNLCKKNVGEMYKVLA
jgi:hypothetical protein